MDIGLCRWGRLERVGVGRSLNRIGLLRENVVKGMQRRLPLRQSVENICRCVFCVAPAHKLYSPPRFIYVPHRSDRMAALCLH